MAENKDVVVRVGSQDYISLQLKSGDPLTVMNLGGTTSVVLHISDLDGDIKCFSTLDATQKLFITDSDNGEIELRPAADDFDTAKKYYYYVDVIDVNGSHPVPEDKNYNWIVIDKITCPA